MLDKSSHIKQAKTPGHQSGAQGVPGGRLYPAGRTAGPWHAMMGR